MQEKTHSFTSLKQRTINFFAIHILLKENTKLEMTIVSKKKKKSQDSDPIWYEFTEMSLKTQVPGLENLRLFSLQLDIFENEQEKSVEMVFQEKGKVKVIEGYKLRVSCYSPDSQKRYYYYEKASARRKFSEMTNIFIFDLTILLNKDYLAEKEPPTKSIDNTLEQAFLFPISLVETGHRDKLQDFYYQYDQLLERSQIRSPYLDSSKCLKAFEYLQGYFENKEIFKITDFNELIALASILSLMPEDYTLINNMVRKQFLDFIKAFENHIDGLLLNKPHLNTFHFIAKNLSFLILVEELNGDTSNWINLIKISSLPEFAKLAGSFITNVMMKDISDQERKKKLSKTFQQYLDLHS